MVIMYVGIKICIIRGCAECRLLMLFNLFVLHQAEYNL